MSAHDALQATRNNVLAQAPRMTQAEAFSSKVEAAGKAVLLLAAPGPRQGFLYGLLKQADGSFLIAEVRRNGGKRFPCPREKAEGLFALPAAARGPALCGAYHEARKQSKKQRGALVGESAHGKLVSRSL